MPKGKRPVSLENTDKHIRFGLNVAFYRERACITQGDLAKKVGIREVYMRKIETANTPTNITVEIVLRLANALNVLPASLLELCGPKTTP